jgi:hypothetical protein
MSDKPKFKPVIEGKGIVPDLHLASWMDREVRYIRDEHQFHLVLYVPCDFDRDSLVGGSSPTPAPRFKSPSSWKLLFHQTAGYACHHRYLYAQFLSPKPAIKKLGKTLLNKYNDSLIAQPVSLTTANEYNALLSEFGLTANWSYTRLEEGFYPIDIECINKVSTQKFSKDLRSQFIKKMPAYKKRSIADVFSDWVNFELAILGPNCD